LGCNHAIYTVRQIVEHFIKGGNTVNLCAINKVNHNALFIKLIKRNLPVVLLDLKNWLKIASQVLNGTIFSQIFFAIKFGVRQGSFCPPYYLQSI